MVLLDCTRIARRFAGYLSGEMTDAQTAEVDAHLLDCPECEAKLLAHAEAPLAGKPAAAVVDEYVAAERQALALAERLTADSTADTPPPIVVSFDLVAAPARPAACCQGAHHHPAPAVRPRRANRMRAVAWVAAVAAAAVAVVGGVWFFTTRGATAGEPNPWREVNGTARGELVRQFPDFLALNHMCERRAEPATIDEKVDELPDPDYSGFEIMRDSKLFDMTDWKPVPPERVGEGRLSPVYMTRVLVLRRLADRPANDRIRFKDWTEGYCVDPVRLRPTDRIREGLRIDYRADRECKVWQHEVDVSDHPPGEVFTVVTAAVFWNGFPDRPDHWAATAVGSSSVARAELGVLLPHGKSVRSWSLWKYPTGRGPAEPENQLRAGAPPRDADGMLYWPVAQITPGHTYELRWTW